MAPLAFVTTIVYDGICLPFGVWETEYASVIFIAWTGSSYFVVPVILFVFCYARIVVVMNRQMKVMAGHNVEAGHMSTSHRHHQSLSGMVQVLLDGKVVLCHTRQKNLDQLQF